MKQNLLFCFLTLAFFALVFFSTGSCFTSKEQRFVRHQYYLIEQDIDGTIRDLKFIGNKVQAGKASAHLINSQSKMVRQLRDLRKEAARLRSQLEQ